MSDPPDFGRLSLGNASFSGASGGAAGDDNLPLTSNPNGTAPSNVIMFGDKEKGAIRFSDFKLRMTKVFQFNAEVGCIFAAAPNSKAVMTFYDELYLSYLQFFKTNPFCYNTPKDLHDALFNAQNQYSYFKHFVVFPNLTHNGLYGFPEDIGAKQVVAKNWLKYYA